MLVITLFPVIAVAGNLYRNGSVDEFMILFLVPFLFVLGSIFFHLEYLKQIKNNQYSGEKRKVKLIYGVFNTLSALTFVCYGVIAIYLFQTDPPPSDMSWVVEIIIIVLLVIGIVSLIDMFLVYKRLKKDSVGVSAEIDKIGN